MAMISSRFANTAAAIAGCYLAGCDAGAPIPDTTTGAPAAPLAVPAARGAITYDHHSVMIGGTPVFLQSAEVHYFRLPSPGLWRDVLEKIKAGGFNTVSVYFNWAYHSPAPGVYDFTGVRDVDRFLRTAEQVGLYVIARPGPYITAETTGGGFPAWIKLVPGRARSSDAGYTTAYRDWLAHINPIIARHQITRGGSVVLYNAENEFAVNTDAAYMEDIQRQAADAGIVVPISHNDCCDAADWTSRWAEGPGAVELPGVDDYPQSFDCTQLDLWGPWGEGVTERLRDDIPVLALEYQAGAIDSLNAGYDQCRALTGPAYMKFFFKSNLMASGATLASYYMGFGGTNWGWLAQPNDVQTSYDYGAAITEARQLTAKFDEFKRQGSFVTSVAPLTRTDPVDACSSDNPAIAPLVRANPDTGTSFVLVRHADRAATTDDSATLDCALPDGRARVAVRVVGRDAKILVAGYDLDGQRLVWSSSELMTHAAVAGTDLAIVYGTEGTAGATVLAYRARPRVHVIDGSVTSAYDPATGQLRLDYVHTGVARVRIDGAGRPPLLLIAASDAGAAEFWRLDTTAGPVVVRGPELVRSAAIRGDELVVRADTAAAGDIEVFTSASRLVVNGERVATSPTRSGSLRGRLAGPAAVHLPALAGWHRHSEAPEAAPAFDDSAWTVADRTTTLSPIAPQTLPVLYADEYGFHYGHVWYRGQFTATGNERTVTVNAATGKNGIYLVWLDGQFLGAAAGANETDAGPPANPDAGRGDFAIPAGLLRRGKRSTLAVLVENLGHNDDWTAEEIRQRQPRGLTGARIDGNAPPGITWRLQGARGGERLVDRARGPLNNGGLFGERSGWHLPDLAQRGWTRIGSIAHAPLSPGVTWYRNEFSLALPRDQDVSVGLQFAGAGATGYRALVFLNGWQIGHVIDLPGFQRSFVLPTGILRPHGDNTLAIAIVAPGPVAMGPGDVQLVVLGNQRGGVTVEDVEAPDLGGRAAAP
jgi:beta-galactosidase GanA